MPARAEHCLLLELLRAEKLSSWTDQRCHVGCCARGRPWQRQKGSKTRKGPGPVCAEKTLDLCVWLKEHACSRESIDSLCSWKPDTQKGLSLQEREITSRTALLMQTSITADISPARTGDANQDATIASSPG